MRVLYLAPHLPSAATGHGGAESTFALLGALAERHDVRVLCFAEESDLAERAALRERGVEVDCIPYDRAPGRRAPVRALAGWLRGLRRGQPFSAAKYDQPRLRRRLRRLLAEFRPDVLHAELPLAPLLVEQPRGGRVLTLCAVPSRLAAFSVQGGLGGLRRRSAAFALSRLRRHEAHMLQDADRVYVFTREDAACLRGLGGATPVSVIGAAVPLPRAASVIPRPDTIAFAASFDFEPNREALTILLERVLPALRARRPEVMLRIAGRRLPERLGRRIERTPGACYEGFVADVEAFFASACLFVAPLRVGSGLKIKVARSLACGTPVLTTAVGAEGIDLKPDDGLFVEEDAQEMAGRCAALLAAPDALAACGRRARTRVAELLAPAVVARDLDRLYRELVPARAGSALEAPAASLAASSPRVR